LIIICGGSGGAEIRQTVSLLWLQAIHGAGQHQGQGVLSRALRAGQNHGMGKPVAGQHLAKPAHGFGIPLEIRKRHVSHSIEKVDKCRCRNVLPCRRSMSV
jgi:hypothetical protein